MFASHQIGAAIAAFGAGYIRDAQGSYDNAFHIAAALCVVAAICCGAIRLDRPDTGLAQEPDTLAADAGEHQAQGPRPLET